MMATASRNSIDGPPSPVSPASPAQAALDQQPPPTTKLKGRHRLLQNLQRISSSPSLTRRGRSSSSSVYCRDGKASLSCVSLTSGSYTPCLGGNNPNQLYGGLAGPSFPTGPSPPASPCNDDNQLGSSPRIRLVGAMDSVNSVLPTQSKSVPVPLELKPVSRGALPTCDVDGEAASEEDEEGHRAIDFWGDMPYELRMRILGFLPPKDILRCALVSKAWHRMCYDGQLWSHIDTPEHYGDIPGVGLVKIITSGGPFVRNLDVRGCAHLPERWLLDGERISEACRNVTSFSAEGCHIDKKSMHSFLLRNSRLQAISVPGVSSVTNSAVKIIAQCCPALEALNVSWCPKVDTGGLKRIVQSCPRLRELRAAEVSGFYDEEFMLEVYERNTVERLDLRYTDITNEGLKILAHGLDPEIDILTGRPIVAKRRLKHLDLNECGDLVDDGVKSLEYALPHLESLVLSNCPELTDISIIALLRNAPYLSYLELEDLPNLTNDTLGELSKSPCASRLEHLAVSFCEALTDVGMLQVLKRCRNLRFVAMDNTRASDLSIFEAGSLVRKRGYTDDKLPRIGMELVTYDCVNITWAGVRDILMSNAYIPRSRRNAAAGSDTPVLSASASPAMSPRNANSPNTSTTKLLASSSTPSPSTTLLPPASYPNEIIKLRCCHPWQMTVDEHTRRVLRGDLAAASRLERKWADYMVATEENGILGARRRRRRIRDAEQRWNADEAGADDGDDGGVTIFGGVGGGRRRAQSGGSCTVM